MRLSQSALFLCRGERGVAESSTCGQSVLFLDADGVLNLRLRSRKNKQAGSLLQRRCSCAACPSICPVHVLWYGYFAELDVGEQPWMTVTANGARTVLRDALKALKVSAVALHPRGCSQYPLHWQVPDVHLYGTHDFRRGHAKVGCTWSLARRASVSKTPCMLRHCRICKSLEPHLRKYSPRANGAVVP